MTEGPKTRFVQGMRDCVPVLIAAAPFGLLFGTLAVKNGFAPWEAVLMSATVYAGASQMVGIELFGERVAPWLIVLSIFAVNFRHVLYSAVLGRQIAHWSFTRKAIAFGFLIDPQFAETEKRLERGQGIDFVWYMGFGIPIYLTWIAEAAVGAHFGALVEAPEALGLDFLLPIYFLILVMGFRHRPLWWPVTAVSGSAALIAYHTVGSPWHVSIGALCGVAVAACWPRPS